MIAVDNASPDDSSARLRDALPGVQVVTAPRNLGFATGCNLAWPRVRGRYWLLLNPDVETNADGIRTFVKWMDENPDVALASAMLDDSSGSPTSVARAFPTLRWTFGELFRVHKLMSARVRSAHLLGPYWDGVPGQVDWVPFAAAIIRREAFERIGPLSEALFMYGEDLEWCWRAQRAGWHIAVCGDVRFVHLGGASAAATWDDAEIDERINAGTAAALRLMHGRTWTRVHAAATALHLYLESIHPRRDKGQRSRSRSGAQAWFREAAGRPPD